MTRSKYQFLFFTYYQWQLVLIFLSTSVSSAVMGDSLKSRIAITLCTQDTNNSGKSFVNKVSPYLKISVLRFKRACPNTERLAGKNHLIATIRQFDGQINLEVKGHIDGQYYEGYRRHIPWVTDTSTPLESTLERNKQVSFALLLETLLFDFEYIRLNFVPVRPTVDLSDFEDDEIDTPAQPSKTLGTGQSVNGKSDAISKPVTTDEESPIEKSDDDETKGSSDVENKDSSNVEDKDSSNVEESDSSNSEESSTKDGEKETKSGIGSSTLGLQGGMAYSPEDTFFIEIDLSYLLKLGRRARLLAHIGHSPWSTFKIGDRPFRTFLFNVGVGGGVGLIERAHLAVLLTAALQLRTNLIKREKIPGATYRTWLDVGAGTALWIHWLIRPLLGVLFTVGIDVYPTARDIVVAEGPRRRFGLISIPTKVGISLTF